MRFFPWIVTLFLVGSFSPLAKLIAMEWSMSVEVPTRIQDGLRKKYPTIQHPEDVQNLLRDLSLFQALESAVAHQKTDGSIFIEAQVAQRIIDIRFKTPTRIYRQALQQIRTQFMKQVDTAGVRADLYQKIKDYFFERGFPNAQILHNVRSLTNKGSIYDIEIQYGRPCLLESVRFEYPLPKGLSFDTKPNDLCDAQAWKKSFADLNTQLFDRGFIRSKLEDPIFSYDVSTNRGQLEIKGRAFERVVYLIDDSNQILAAKDIFKGSEAINPLLLNPESMRTEVQRYYRREGFEEVVVEPATERFNAQDQEVVYEFKVQTGIRYELEKLEFIGRQAFTESELLNQLDIGSFWFRTPYLDSEKISEAVDKISSLYKSKGFWNVRIQAPRIVLDQKASKAKVVIQIEEGLQRVMGDLKVTGLDPSIEIQFDLERTEALDQNEVVSLQKKIRQQLNEKSYLYAQVEIHLEEKVGLKQSLVDVHLRVISGPAVKIGDIQVAGTIDTQDKVVYRELYFERGDAYDPFLIDLSRRNLLRLGIFQSVQILPRDRNALSEQAEIIDLVIEVREAKPGNIAFGPGWSLFKGQRFGMEASYNNIGGVGRQVFSRARLSEESQQQAIGRKSLVGRSLAVGYLEPHIFDWPINVTTVGTHNARADDKWYLGYGGEVAASHQFRKILFGSTLTGFYSQKANREESLLSQRIGYLDLLGGFTQIGSVGLRYEWDYRDDPSWPRKGFIFRTEYAMARYYMYGNTNYDYWNTAFSFYQGLTEKFVFAAGLSLASYLNVDRKGDRADVLPQAETMYVGGADTIRGFRERSLGPVVEYTAIEDGAEVVKREVLGGSQSAVFKTELRYQLIEQTLGISGFIDFGNVFFKKEEMKSFFEKAQDKRDETGQAPVIRDNHPYYFDEFLKSPHIFWDRNYYSYGTALNYLTPLGSVNLSYGLPWKRCVGDDCIERGAKGKSFLLEGQFHLNIGTTF
jgi:outer membrane protein insertion porin family